jgi:hypothetical protein
MAAGLLSWLGVADPTEAAPVGKAHADGRDAESWGETTPHAHAGGLGPCGCALAFEATQRLLAVADTSGRMKVHGSIGSALLAGGSGGGATIDIAFMPAHACLLRLTAVRVPQALPGPLVQPRDAQSAHTSARRVDVRL